VLDATVAQWEPLCTTLVASWCCLVGAFVLQDDDVAGPPGDMRGSGLLFL
jgi:hypothetical protein